ncbi:MAG: serine hydrolase [Actinomycetes bacterium]
MSFPINPPRELSQEEWDLWQEGPLNRWAMQHVADFIPTCEILPSLSPYVWPEEIAPNEKIQSELLDLYTDGLLIVKHGKIVYENYLNGMVLDTRHLLQSVSKSILGILIGQLVSEGLIATDQTIGYYLPQMQNSGYSDATVQNALDMCVGVKFSEEYHDLDSEIQVIDRVSGWRSSHPGDPEGVRAFLPMISKEREHGKYFQYCSANTDVLAWVAEAVTGIPYVQLLSDRIWKPLGATYSANMTMDNYGSPLANGGVSTTLRDLALFGQMVLNGGVINGHQIATPEWLLDTVTGAPSGSPIVDSMQKVHPGGSYRNQFWITHGAHKEIYGVGIYGQHLWIDPVTQTVIVKFSSLPVATTPEHSLAHANLFRELSS